MKLRNLQNVACKVQFPLYHHDKILILFNLWNLFFIYLFDTKALSSNMRVGEQVGSRSAEPWRYCAKNHYDLKLVSFAEKFSSKRI